MWFGLFAQAVGMTRLVNIDRLSGEQRAKTGRRFAGGATQRGISHPIRGTRQRRLELRTDKCRGLWRDAARITWTGKTLKSASGWLALSWSIPMTPRERVTVLNSLIVSKRLKHALEYNCELAGSNIWSCGRATRAAGFGGRILNKRQIRIQIRSGIAGSSCTLGRLLPLKSKFPERAGPNRSFRRGFPVCKCRKKPLAFNRAHTPVCKHKLLI